MEREHDRPDILSRGIDKILGQSIPSAPANGSAHDPELAPLQDTAAVVADSLGSAQLRPEARALIRARFIAAARRRSMPLPATDGVASHTLLHSTVGIRRIHP